MTINISPFSSRISWASWVSTASYKLQKWFNISTNIRISIAYLGVLSPALMIEDVPIHIKGELDLSFRDVQIFAVVRRSPIKIEGLWGIWMNTIAAFLQYNKFLTWPLLYRLFHCSNGHFNGVNPKKHRPPTWMMYRERVSTYCFEFMVRLMLSKAWC